MSVPGTASDIAAQANVKFHGNLGSKRSTLETAKLETGTRCFDPWQYNMSRTGIFPCRNLPQAPSDVSIAGSSDSQAMYVSSAKYRRPGPACRKAPRKP